MKDVAEFFRVLADKARLKMLWLLFHREELCVCDFMEVLHITQSKASRHLRILYGAGLVTDRRDGLWVYYRLRPLPDGLAQGQLDRLRTHLAARPDAARLLEELSGWLRSKEPGGSCVRKRASDPVPAAAAVPSQASHGGRRS